MIKSIYNTLLDLDMFGYSITLYYNSDSRKKKSICGVIATIILSIILTVYVASLSNQLGRTEYQTVQQVEYFINDKNE